MPAKDRYHDIVIRAFSKRGWRVLKEQYALNLPERRLFVDLHIERPNENGTALIEIKDFLNIPSPVDYLASTVGQITLYQLILERLKLSIPLFVAVPEAAFDSIMGESLGQMVIARLGIRFVLFDPVQEEITRWIP